MLPIEFLKVPNFIGNSTKWYQRKMKGVTALHILRLEIRIVLFFYWSGGETPPPRCVRHWGLNAISTEVILTCGASVTQSVTIQKLCLQAIHNFIMECRTALNAYV